jgi:RimJ/RimL family protein N-acetyltransferase
MRAAPTLETARLVLRPFRESDLEPIAAAAADPEAVRFLGGTVATREETWRKLATIPGMWALLGYGYWIVERTSDHVVIGQAGFADFKRDIAPAIEGLPEMGWSFVRHAWGQGYASEAVTAALRWIDEALAPSEVVAIIDEQNLASIRVAEKTGFAQKETARYKSEPILLFRRKL